MRIPRVLLPEVKPEQQSRWSLDRDTRHYLVNVLRLKPGRELVVFDGQNERESKAVMISADKKSAEIEIIDTYLTERESPLSIQLYLGISKSDHMDIAIQKSVELGVTSIHPVICERTQKMPDGDRLLKKMEHWEGIIRSACEQSGRSIKPELSPPLTFSSSLAETDPSSTFILSPTASEALNEQSVNVNVSVFIGPEGGFSHDEIESALDHGVKEIRMGPRILRTETAVITTISGLQFYFGDLN